MRRTRFRKPRTLGEALILAGAAGLTAWISHYFQPIVQAENRSPSPQQASAPVTTALAPLPRSAPVDQIEALSGLPLLHATVPAGTTPASHLYNLLPYGLPSTENIVVRKGYIASVNFKKRVPNWVAELFTPAPLPTSLQIASTGGGSKQSQPTSPSSPPSSPQLLDQPGLSSANSLPQQPQLPSLPGGVPLDSRSIPMKGVEEDDALALLETDTSVREGQRKDKEKEEGGGKRRGERSKGKNGEDSEEIIYYTDRHGNVKVDRSTFRFKPDPAVPPLFRATTGDYANTGYARGHLAAAAGHSMDAEEMAETFYLSSNIIPQNQWMNAGDWNKLERFSRALTKYFAHVRVITGPIYMPRPKDMSKVVEYEVVGSTEVAVPTHLFKVLYLEGPRDADMNAALQKIMQPRVLMGVGRLRLGSDGRSSNKSADLYRRQVEKYEERLNIYNNKSNSNSGNNSNPLLSNSTASGNSNSLTSPTLSTSPMPILPSPPNNAPREVVILAFRMSNNAASKDMPLYTYITDISEIEKATGLSLTPGGRGLEVLQAMSNNNNNNSSSFTSNSVESSIAYVPQHALTMRTSDVIV